MQLEGEEKERRIIFFREIGRNENLGKKQEKLLFFRKLRKEKWFSREGKFPLFFRSFSFNLK